MILSISPPTSPSTTLLVVAVLIECSKVTWLVVDGETPSLCLIVKCIVILILCHLAVFISRCNGCYCTVKCYSSFHCTAFFIALFGIGSYVMGNLLKASSVISSVQLGLDFLTSRIENSNFKLSKFY